MYKSKRQETFITKQMLLFVENQMENQKLKITFSYFIQ